MTQTHHHFGGSKFGLRARCPASLRESEGMPDLFADEMALKGQELHRLMVPGAEPSKEAWSDFEHDMIQRALAWRAAELGPNADLAKYEVKLGPVPLEGVSERDWPHAWLDWLLLLDGGLGVIADYKFGPLELEDDLTAAQMYLEAFLALRTYPELRSVRLLVYHVWSDTEYSDTIERADLPKLERRVREVIERCREPEPVYRPSASGCGRCLGAARCPVAVSLMPIQAERLPPLERMAPGALAGLYERAGIALEVAERVRQAVKERVVAESIQLPGYKLKGPSYQRSLPNAYGAWVQYEADCGKRRALLLEFLGACRLSITALSKLWCGHYRSEHRVSVKEAEAMFDRKFEDLIVRGEPFFQLRRSTPKKELTDDS